MRGGMSFGLGSSTFVSSGGAVRGGAVEGLTRSSARGGAPSTMVSCETSGAALPAASDVACS